MFCMFSYYSSTLYSYSFNIIRVRKWYHTFLRIYIESKDLLKVEVCVKQDLTHPDERDVLLGAHSHGGDVRGVDKQGAVVVDIHHCHVDHSLSQHLHTVTINVFSLQQKPLVHGLFMMISFIVPVSTQWAKLLWDPSWSIRVWVNTTGSINKSY